MVSAVPEPMILHNAKEKSYPDGSKSITVCSRAIFKDDGWELRKEAAEEDRQEKIPKPKNMDGEVRNDSLRRAVHAIFDIVKMNPKLFTHFITWTLDKEKIDRYSPKEVSKKLLKFLNNMVSRHNLHYVIIAEHTSVLSVRS